MIKVFNRHFWKSSIQKRVLSRTNVHLTNVDCEQSRVFLFSHSGSKARVGDEERGRKPQSLLLCHH